MTVRFKSVFSFFLFGQHCMEPSLFVWAVLEEWYVRQPPRECLISYALTISSFSFSKWVINKVSFLFIWKLDRVSLSIVEFPEEYLFFSFVDRTFLLLFFHLRSDIAILLVVVRASSIFIDLNTMRKKIIIQVYVSNRQKRGMCVCLHTNFEIVSERSNLNDLGFLPT